MAQIFKKWNPTEHCIPGKVQDISYEALLWNIARNPELVEIYNEIISHKQFEPLYRTVCERSSNKSEVLYEMLCEATKRGLISLNNIHWIRQIIESSNLFIGNSEAKVTKLKTVQIGSIA